MQTLKVEILDEDVEDYTVDDIYELAQTISEGYRYDQYKGAHVRVTDEDTGIVVDFNPCK